MSQGRLIRYQRGLCICRAAQAGVAIIRSGENLVLRAPASPAAEVVDLLVLHKPEIVVLIKAKSFRRESGGWPAVPSAAEAVARSPLGLAQEAHGTREPLSRREVAIFQSAVPEDGEGGGSEPRIRANRRPTSQADDSDPNPDLPWPQPGETVLPGWGTRVSMEYRLRTASEDECLEWAEEPWQVELVAKARGYFPAWVSQILLNRTTWRKVFAALDADRSRDSDASSARAMGGRAICFSG